MVFCGPPSRGCFGCRKRKVRCDLREPACGQCEKYGQPCPGYRDLTDLMFRDQSSHVIHKAKARAGTRGNRKKARGPPKTRPRNISAPQPRPQPLPQPRPPEPRAPVLAALVPGSDGCPAGVPARQPHYALSYSLQEQGIAFFFSRFVVADTGCHQNYSFVYHVWKPSDSVPGHLDRVTASMVAAGLAGLSTLTRNPQAMVQAQQSYCTALQLTNAALNDPCEAIKDTTMLAVLVLGTYEFISGCSPQTMRAWKEHVVGAATLASMRGTAQFRSKAGVRMFLMLCHAVLISCVQSGLPMPQSMVELRSKVPRTADGDDPAWEIADRIYMALQIRYDIRVARITDVRDIVEKLSHIDSELAVILTHLPPSWHYRRVEIRRPDPRIFGVSCHLFPGLPQATTWNGVRSIRMLVLETILEQLSPAYNGTGPPRLPYDHQVILAKTVRLLEMLREAIVASVPQYFGLVSFRDFPKDKAAMAPCSIPVKHMACQVRPPAAAAGSKPEHTPKIWPDSRRPSLLDPIQSGIQDGGAEQFMALASTNNPIIWPLYILGMSSSCSLLMRQYAIDRLNAIHQETGLEQARIVAGMLEARVPPTAWEPACLGWLPQLPEDALPDWV